MKDTKNFDEQSISMNKILEESKLSMIREIPLNIIDKSLFKHNNKSLCQSLSTQTSYINTVSISIKENNKVNSILNKKNSKIGNTNNLFFANKYLIISIGPDFYYSLFFLFIMTSIYFLFLFFLCEKGGVVLNFLFKINFFIYLISHFFSIIINPGIPSFNYNEKNLEIMKKIKDINNNMHFHICKSCGLMIKAKDRVHHCSKCNICYLQHKFHSKLIGHCVAKNNLIFYYCCEITIWFFLLVSISIVFVNILKLMFKM